MMIKWLLASVLLVLAAAPALAEVDVGDKPALELKSTDGTSITSDNLKGKLVLLDF